MGTTSFPKGKGNIPLLPIRDNGSGHIRRNNRPNVAPGPDSVRRWEKWLLACSIPCNLFCLVNFLYRTFASKINIKELDRKIRVGAVSYLNTKPLLYGIRQAEIISSIELTIDYPSRIASMLLRDEIDIGLVPVAIIPQMKEYHINGDFCIGSDGPVASVCLFSEEPMDRIEKVLLDYQSRTSVELARVLLKQYWKIAPELADGGEDFQDHIGGTTAGGGIGAPALG